MSWAETKTILDAIKSTLQAVTDKKTGVKSIQRGRHNGNTSGSNITINLPQQVDPDKCIVLLQTAAAGGTGVESMISASNSLLSAQPTLVSISSGNFIVSCSRYRKSPSVAEIAIPFSWQVIEFY